MNQTMITEETWMLMADCKINSYRSLRPISNELIMEMYQAIKSALKIGDLWKANCHETYHANEMQALSAMKKSFEKVIAKVEGGSCE